MRLNKRGAVLAGLVAAIAVTALLIHHLAAARQTPVLRHAVLGYKPSAAALTPLGITPTSRDATTTTGPAPTAMTGAGSAARRVDRDGVTPGARTPRTTI